MPLSNAHWYVTDTWLIRHRYLAEQNEAERQIEKNARKSHVYLYMSKVLPLQRIWKLITIRIIPLYKHQRWNVSFAFFYASKCYCFIFVSKCHLFQIILYAYFLIFRCAKWGFFIVCSKKMVFYRAKNTKKIGQKNQNLGGVWGYYNIYIIYNIFLANTLIHKNVKHLLLWNIWSKFSFVRMKLGVAQG